MCFVVCLEKPEVVVLVVMVKAELNGSSFSVELQFFMVFIVDLCQLLALCMMLN